MRGVDFLYVIALLLIAAVAIAGCTGETSETGASSDQSATPQSVVTIGVPDPTTAIATATATPTPTPTETSTPTATPTETLPYSPQYSAGDLLEEPKSGTFRLVTRVMADSEQYMVRLAFELEDERFLKKDGSFQEMGETVDSHDFERMGLIPAGTVERIAIYLGADEVYGYLEYETPETMVFAKPSPEKLTGEVNFVLEIWYNGEVDIYSTMGNETAAHTTHTISEFRSFELGEDTRAYLRIYKDYSTKWMKATLKADGVTVREKEAGNGIRTVVLSFST